MEVDRITNKTRNLFWDHTKKAWVHKRYDLKRVPMKYRCPSCGKIVVEPKDRDPSITNITIEAKQEKHYKVGEGFIIKITPLKLLVDTLGYRKGTIWCDYIRITYSIPNKYERTAERVLGGIFGYGGVCFKCWTDGKGELRDNIYSKVYRAGLRGELNTVEDVNKFLKQEKQEE